MYEFNPSEVLTKIKRKINICTYGPIMLSVAIVFFIYINNFEEKGYNHIIIFEIILFFVLVVWITKMILLRRVLMRPFLDFSNNARTEISSISNYSEIQIFTYFCLMLEQEKDIKERELVLNMMVEKGMLEKPTFHNTVKKISSAYSRGTDIILYDKFLFICSMSGEITDPEIVKLKEILLYRKHKYLLYNVSMYYRKNNRIKKRRFRLWDNEIWLKVFEENDIKEYAGAKKSN